MDYYNLFVLSALKLVSLQDLYLQENNYSYIILTYTD